jgi:nicotinamide-nucleotide amidase
MKAPRVMLIAIGDELITERPDTNTQMAAAEFQAAGWQVLGRLQVPDETSAIQKALRQARIGAELALCCGGLGPTQDDRTRQAIAQLCRRPLRSHRPSQAALRKRLAAAGRTFAPQHAQQTMLPEGSVVIPNAHGIAIGFRLLWGKLQIAALPGPPNECIPMLKDMVFPWCDRRFGKQPPLCQERILRTSGLGEAALEERLAPLSGLGPAVELGFLIDTPGEILVKVRVRGQEPGARSALLTRAVSRAKFLLGKELVIGTGASGLAHSVQKMLARRKQTIACAESCSGGRLAARLTAIAGASRVFSGGVVAYANDIKMRMLGVSDALLNKWGAVSEPVAAAMAQGVRKKFRSDWGIATTGIAGPGGGSAQKPVGLVYVAVAGPSGTCRTERLRLTGGRNWNQEAAATAAMNALRRRLHAEA